MKISVRCGAAGEVENGLHKNLEMWDKAVKSISMKINLTKNIGGIQRGKFNKQFNKRC